MCILQAPFKIKYRERFFFKWKCSLTDEEENKQNMHEKIKSDLSDEFPIYIL